MGGTTGPLSPRNCASVRPNPGLPGSEPAEHFLTSGVAMSSVRRFAICLLASVGLLLVSVLPASAETGGVPFRVELTGEAEVNAAGVPTRGTWTPPAPQP